MNNGNPSTYNKFIDNLPVTNDFHMWSPPSNDQHIVTSGPTLASTPIVWDRLETASDQQLYLQKPTTSAEHEGL